MIEYKNDWKNTIYSCSYGEYVSNPYPEIGDELKISLSFKKNDEVKHVFLRQRIFGLERLTEMTLEQEFCGICYYSVKIKAEEKRITYQFYITTASKIFYYTQGGVTEFLPDEGRDFVINAGYKGCSWINTSVFYQIFPDRFCNGNPEIGVKKDEYTYNGFKPCPVKDFNQKPQEYDVGHSMDFHNGDLYGIIQKLDYLQELGINAIYLNPIFISPSTHKYDCLDYSHVDPHLGGDEALQQLIEEVHKRGMHIILDISINHTSSEHVWFTQAASEKENPLREFYFFENDGTYDTWCGVQTMPKLNYSSEKLKKVIFKDKDGILKKWLLPPYNADGWRFDVAESIARNGKCDLHKEVLEEIRKELKSARENLYLVAEDWADCSEDLQGDRWDSTMNYFGCNRPIRQFIGMNDLFNQRNLILDSVRPDYTASMLWKQVSGFYSRMPGIIQNQMFNLLDSHDVTRLYNYTDIAEKSYLGAVKMMFTLPGVPCVYYGDEIALEGQTDQVEYCRAAFDWNYKNKQKSVERREFYKKLIKLRKDCDALKNGGFRLVSDEGYVICFARFVKGNTIFTVWSMNKNAEPSQVKIPLADFGITSFTSKTDIFGSKLDYKIEETTLLLTVKPLESYVIKA